MKIRCDVCDNQEASIFCPSDEAALCNSCDRHVHRANKLASNHSRFSLLSPTDSPLCDICQVRRAFLFCQEDRAILCRECDISIHRANEHTQKHSRFLLTGLGIPSVSSFDSSSHGGGVESAAIGDEFRRKSSITEAKIDSDLLFRPPLMNNVEKSIGFEVEEGEMSDGVSYSRSSISEYLESLPGWCVEEFLDSTSASNVYCKV